MMCIREYLQAQRVPFEVLLHRPTPSATRLAQSVHVPGHRVAKAVLLRAGGGFVLAVLPATHRIVLECLSEVLGIREIRIATEDEVEGVFTDCQRGALPPFGRLYGLATLVDASLAGEVDIVFEGNTRHEGVRMSYRDFEALEAPLRAQFAMAITPRRPRLTHRRAG
jgi:Ala-tRNA(Pro) deacylase